MSTATLVVASALIQVVVEGRTGPWELDESLWGQVLPERLPAGRSEWRNAHCALQAAGCLAAGVWLDVGRQESFWQLPLWPYTVDLVELLSRIAQQEAAVSSRVLADQVQFLLRPSLSR